MPSNCRHNYYDYISRGYGELYKEEQSKKLRIINENLKTDFILDVGCGCGLSNNVFSCKIIGIDLSFNLLKKADFPKVLAAAENLPFKAMSFENIICVTAIHNFKNYKNALSEMKRVMKKSGAITVLKRSKKCDNIVKEIKRNFNVIKEIDEEKDRILIVRV
jgi:ubiquinone/menaquinone biosynthesis C-methylase UbiE